MLAIAKHSIAKWGHDVRISEQILKKIVNTFHFFSSGPLVGGKKLCKVFIRKITENWFETGLRSRKNT